jgi:hypothetical protein
MPTLVTPVDKAKALDTAPAERKATASETVRFIRTMSPDQPLELGSNRVVSFHVAINNVTGARAAFGEYCTSDSDEIKALREVVATKPHLYVYEEPRQ